MADRRPIVAANWKMHKTHLEAIQAVQKLSYLLDRTDADLVEVVICPPFTALRSVQTLIDSDRLPYGLGAQDVHHEDEGAFTGAVSAAMVADFGCQYAIVGHSERRTVFGDTDDVVARKFAAAVRVGLTPILCVGESLSEREAGITEVVVARQVDAVLKQVGVASLERAVIAYEPVWAIGTGKTATSRQAQEVHAHIRTLLVELWGADAAGQVRIQYGGSVKPDNAATLLGQPDVDGALVGGASVVPEEFVTICRLGDRTPRR